MKGAVLEYEEQEEAEASSPATTVGSCMEHPCKGEILKTL